MDQAPADAPGGRDGGALDLIARGHLAAGERRFAEAESFFRQAIALNPNLPMAYNNLGWALDRQGRTDDAAQAYRVALELNPNLSLARVNLANLYARTGQTDLARPLWSALAAAAPTDEPLLSAIVTAALNSGDLHSAAAHAAQLATLRHGPSASPAPAISNDKLNHDIAKFAYLRDRGVADLDDKLSRLHRALETTRHRGLGVSFAMDDNLRALIGDIHGRILHLHGAPRVPMALGAWMPRDAEQTYLDHPFGLVVIDDFLAPAALASLRDFCLYSTLWFGNRYAHGRLGAFFRDGFNAPLLIQIAEELQATFPRIIGHTHLLQQIWGFKYGHAQPATNPHADFAAVNVNFWITPDDANLDPRTGGMLVYDLEAPPDWPFKTYNENGARIAALLREKQSAATYIPYKSNRAIIFNSDLFHTTAPLTFRPGYEYRRVNVTMLYGKREDANERCSGARRPSHGSGA